jgi:hypothetical protein
MSFLKRWLTPYQTCTPETAKKIRQSVMPFSEIGEHLEHREEAKAAYHRLGEGDKLLILLFVLNSIMLVATAIYAPTVTYTWFYKGWQGVQFAFMVYLAYHISHRRR